MDDDARDCFGLLTARIDGKYRVDSVVGEGGFGVVYRGTHEGFEAPVAIKCLKIPASLSGGAMTSGSQQIIERHDRHTVHLPWRAPLGGWNE